MCPPSEKPCLPIRRAPASGPWSHAPATLNKLNADIVKALQVAEVRARLDQADTELVGSKPEQCDAFLREQVAVWGKTVKASGAKVD